MFRATDSRLPDEPTAQHPTWLQLEPELVSAVANKLSARDIASLRLTCKQWKIAISDGITNLTVSRKVVKDQIRYIGNAFPRVEVLDLSGYAWLTDTEMEGVKELRFLKDFTLIFGHELSDVGLRLFQNLTHLERLSLVNFVRLDDSNLQHLAVLTQLTELSIQGAPRVSNSGLQHLEKVANLRHLTIGYAPEISDAGLPSLAQLTRLEDLSLHGCSGFDGTGLSHLEGLKSLKRLNLSRTKVTDRGMQSLQGLTFLKHLSLAFCKISNAGLMHIRDLRLDSLDLTKCELVTSKGIQSLPFWEGSNGMSHLANGKIQPKEVLQCFINGKTKQELLDDDTSDAPATVPSL